MQQHSSEILDYSVFSGGKVECVKEIASALRDGMFTSKWLACINPHSYVVAMNDPDFSRCMKSADWLVPDGIGVVLASRLLGGDIRSRVSGSDIFFGVMAELNRIGGSVFFLGASESTLDNITQKITFDYPKVTVVGSFAPPYIVGNHFDADTSETMVSKVNEVNPDVLWVGLTSPKQDLWLEQNLPQLEVRFAAGVGAVFDFYGGSVKRPGEVWQNAGLEWLPRLLLEPTRLWRRTFVSAPIFIWAVLKRKFGRQAA